MTNGNSKKSNKYLKLLQEKKISRIYYVNGIPRSVLFGTTGCADYELISIEDLLSNFVNDDTMHEFAVKKGYKD